jgi:thiamine kinase-like enzyme
MLRKTIEQLPYIQFFGAENFDFSVCYPQPEFNCRTVMWDLNYFKYCFLKLQNIDFQENILENDFENFAKSLLNVPFGNKFMYRDFQSRNVMLKDEKPYFIDFQGARRGAIYYDLASFLWQASANFPPDLKEDLTQIYLQNLRKFTDFSEQEFRENLNVFALFRTLQVLGAYGFRGLIEKKQHFIDSIIFAIKNLKEIIENVPNENFQYLIKILKQLTDLEQFKPKQKREKLLVRIFSFSYKKGIPADVSGNGGGFVFDCRAINNPGKYLEYKHLTGLDKEVIEFLVNDGEILKFLENCYSLADKSVSNYAKRGFTNLQIAFGCTGGQHRSVYCAQKMSEHLKEKFNVDVELKHRELMC